MRPGSDAMHNTFSATNARHSKKLLHECYLLLSCCVLVKDESCLGQRAMET